MVNVMPTARCPALTFSPTSLPSGEPGARYTAMVSATGASAPATFTLASGALPEGPTLAADGTLSGTLPATDAVFTFSILASAPYACTQTQGFTITVGDPVFEMPDGGTPDGGTVTPPAKGGCAVACEGGAAGTHLLFALLALAWLMRSRARRR